MATTQESFYTVRPSNIHGNGAFTTKTFLKNSIIGDGIVYTYFAIPKITPFGKMINHSYNPSAYLLYNKKRAVWQIHARHHLPIGTEITIDYNFTPFFIAKPDPKWK